MGSPDNNKGRPGTPGEPMPRYEKPTIVAYDEETLLSRTGPAVACARWDAGGAFTAEEWDLITEVAGEDERF